MARLAMIITITFSLFLLSLARQSIDLPPSIETSTSLTINPNPNNSTDLQISDPIKEQVKEEERQRDESPDSDVAAWEELDADIILGWDPREEEEPKVEKTITKKRCKRSDESDSDSDSDSDDDEEGEEKKKKKKKSKKVKKGGFIRWFWRKLMNFFD